MSRVAIDMTPELLADLRERAEARGITVTELIRRGVALDKLVHENLDRVVTITQVPGDELPRLVISDRVGATPAEDDQ